MPEIATVGPVSHGDSAAEYSDLSDLEIDAVPSSPHVHFSAPPTSQAKSRASQRPPRPARSAAARARAQEDAICDTSDIPTIESDASDYDLQDVSLDSQQQQQGATLSAQEAVAAAAAEGLTEAELNRLPENGVFASAKYYVDGVGKHWWDPEGTDNWQEVPADRKASLRFTESDIVVEHIPAEAQDNAADEQQDTGSQGSVAAEPSAATAAESDAEAVGPPVAAFGAPPIGFFNPAGKSAGAGTKAGAAAAGTKKQPKRKHRPAYWSADNSAASTPTKPLVQPGSDSLTAAGPATASAPTSPAAAKRGMFGSFIGSISGFLSRSGDATEQEPDEPADLLNPDLPPPILGALKEDDADGPPAAAGPGAGPSLGAPPTGSALGPPPADGRLPGASPPTAPTAAGASLPSMPAEEDSDSVSSMDSNEYFSQFYDQY